MAHQINDPEGKLNLRFFIEIIGFHINPLTYAHIREKTTDA